ncbi:tetratricopeptide repeat protein [Silvibacterium sp.]|uniref:tetratricopeptide repeat protein n=1 Tax=Silvibacterium sp. TaxID=1964179 RepID=UPI0039E61E2C
MRLKSFSLLLIVVLSAIPAASSRAVAQEASATASRAEEKQGRLLLVLPFANQTGQQSLDWIGEAAADILNRRLNSAGFLSISRGDRLYALDRLGLPLNLAPSRATTIRIAENLDADDVIVGSYTLENGQLGFKAQILDIGTLTLSAPLTQQAELKSLMDTLNGLAWNVARKLDPSYAVAEQTFLAADSPLRVDAFEAYIRGVTTDSPTDRIVHMREAVRLSPSFMPAWLALGRAYFSNQNYDEAAETLGHLSKDDPNALEADFYRGLAFFYTANYMKAEDAFAFVSLRLPLPEVVNNQGVAASRRGRDAGPQFQQAIAADPRDEDYHFNLAVALRKRNDIPGAIREIDAALKLRPLDSEAQTFSTQLKDPSTIKVNPDPGKAIVDDSLPLERIKRSYSETSFRQAAFEMEQLQSARLAALPPAAQAASLVKDGEQFLNRGLILEAEREFQSALHADPNSAAAHEGLAEVREHSRDVDAARQEAQKSLTLQPNVPAHLVLARLDLATNQLAPAASEVSAALKIDPNNANAKGMKQAVEARGQQVP